MAGHKYDRRRGECPFDFFSRIRPFSCGDLALAVLLLLIGQEQIYNSGHFAYLITHNNLHIGNRCGISAMNESRGTP